MPLLSFKVFTIFSVSGAFLKNFILSLSHCTPAPAIKIDPSIAYIGEGLIFSEVKKTKMKKITVEGADLAKEIAKKVNEDFGEEKLPLMIGMINAIVDDKQLKLNWEAFR